MGGVNEHPTLSPLGKILSDSLQQIDYYESRLARDREHATMHVSTVGSKLSSAYEQLRNASEYTEDTMLRQRAIRRFLVRTLSFHEKSNTKDLASELITELTQAEYLPNDHVTKSEVKTIAHHIKRYYSAYWHYCQIERDADRRQKFQSWVLDVLCVRCEQTLESNIRQLSFTHFAFTYLQQHLQLDQVLQDNESITADDFPIMLYIAIQRSLLKSDTPSIRAALLDSYRQDITFIHNFEAFNQRIDTLVDLKTTTYLTRIVNRNGAPLRFVYSGFYAKQAPLGLKDLQKEETLEYSLRQHIEREYSQLNKRLDKGIIKSIIFLLITKSIIGLAIEIPYDFAVIGHIIWLPLILNLFFPSIFIAFSRFTLPTPSERNTVTLIDQIADLIFAGRNTEELKIKVPKKTKAVGFNIAYAITFLLAFAGLTYILILLEFNIVQGIIFFIFLSTASFLAFRLSNQIRELESVAAPQGSLAVIRDVIYMPFIYVGQQISYRYAKINIVATVLDMVIELPLKTVLRLVRQWTVFLSAKKDELV